MAYYIGRLKSLAGGKGLSDTQKTVASATSTAINDGENFLLISGSATITSLVAAQSTRDREVTFIGAASASVTFTNTTGTTTANQMDLGGTNITLAAGDLLQLILRANGVWNIVHYRRNNATTISLASASTLVIPNTSDVFSISGTTGVTGLTVTTPGKPRRLTFYGESGAAVSFTNADSPTAGQMNLRGLDRLLLEDYVLELLVKTDGTITLIGSTG